MLDAAMADQDMLSVAIHQNAVADAAPEARLRGLERALRQTTGAALDLVLCPELFLSGYGAGARIKDLAEPADGPFAKRIAALARQNKCCIVYGYPEAADGVVYNSALAIGPDGAQIANHRKLVLPNAYEKNLFETGDRLTFFTLRGWKVAIVICYDVEFPEIVRACVVQEASLVLAPTALAHQWDVVARKVLPARAFENGVFIGYANHGGCDELTRYLGESCILAPDGSELARAGDMGDFISASLDHAGVVTARSRLNYLPDSEGLYALRKTGRLDPMPQARGNTA
jgi:predicted amidohydrolase